MNDDIYTFYLKTQNLGREERFVIIKELYDNLLKDDYYWHFFYEDEFGDFLRVSKENSNLLEELLKAKGIEYKLECFWKEDIAAVVANQDYFGHIFHINSVLVMELSDHVDDIIKDLPMYIDRYSHSLHDMLHLATDKPIMSIEANHIAEASLMRAKYDGYIAHYKKHSSKKEEK